jgi:hypothetical protein
MNGFDDEMIKKKRGFLGFQELADQGDQGDYGSQGFLNQIIPGLRDRQSQQAYDADTKKFFSHNQILSRANPFYIRSVDPAKSGGRDIEIFRTGLGGQGNKDSVYEVFNYDLPHGDRWRVAERPKSGGLSKSATAGSGLPGSGYYDARTGQYGGRDPEAYADDYDTFRKGQYVSQGLARIKK